MNVVRFRDGSEALQETGKDQEQPVSKPGQIDFGAVLSRIGKELVTFALPVQEDLRCGQIFQRPNGSDSPFKWRLRYLPTWSRQGGGRKDRDRTGGDAICAGTGSISPASTDLETGLHLKYSAWSSA